MGGVASPTNLKSTCLSRVELTWPPFTYLTTQPERRERGKKEEQGVGVGGGSEMGSMSRGGRGERWERGGRSRSRGWGEEVRWGV